MDPTRPRPKSSAAALAGASLGAGMLAAAALAAAAGGRDGAAPLAATPAATPPLMAAAPRAAALEPAPAARPIAAAASPEQTARRGEGRRPEPVAMAFDVEGPALAVIIDDAGFDADALERLLSLDIPLTVSVLPYAPDAPETARRVTASGREVFVHLPMEPDGLEDPGPFAITTAMSADAAARRAAWALARVPGAAGVNNHMGSRLTADASAVSRALAVYAGSDLVFVDSVTAPDSVAAEAAARLGIVSARRDVFLDHVRDAGAISAQIDAAIATARSEGAAIAIGHPYPETVSALSVLRARAEAAGVTLVPARTLVERTHRTGRASPALTAQAGASPARVD